MPPDATHSIAFVPVGPAHYPLLAVWLASPHMREWWGDPEEELGYIKDMVEGRDTTRPFIILLRGEPVGYIQYWFIGHHQNDEWIKDNPWLMELSSDAVGIDLSLGDPEMLSQGIGSAALSDFVAFLRAEGHETVIIDPDPANIRAVRSYSRAGFAPIPELEGRTGDTVLIMQHHLKATQ